MKAIMRWWRQPARAWQFWMPGSGLPGGVVMGSILGTCALLLIAACSGPSIPPKTSCEKLRDYIADRLGARGIGGFVLEIRDASNAGHGRIVGRCEQGTKIITYSRKT